MEVIGLGCLRCFVLSLRLLQLDFFDLSEGFNLMAFGDVWQGLGGW
jgi:hypothetical protein